MNVVILIGNLGKDPEIRKTESGQSVANMILATSENYTNKEGKKIEQTEWHNIVVYGKVVDAFISKYLKKGDKVSVRGRIRTRTWEDKNGVKNYKTEITSDDLQSLSFKAREGTTNDPAPAAVGPRIPILSEEIPF